MASVFKSDKRPYWMIQWVDHSGRTRQRSSRSTNKRVAERIAARWQEESALRREGLITPDMDARLGAVSETIKGYKTSLKARGSSPQYVSETIKLIEDVVALAGWVRMGDVAAAGLEKHMHDLREGGKSSRTVQKTARAVKSWVRWCIKRGDLSVDPFVSVGVPGVTRDQNRRAVSPDEWRVLSSAISGDVFKIPAVERRLLYWLAIETGLRAGELRALTWGDVQENAETPYIAVRASTTKSGRRAQQFLSPMLAKALKAKRKRHTGNGSAQVVMLPDKYRMADMFRRDVDAAREQWLAEGGVKASDFLLTPDAAGRMLDFHCLRYTCGAWLALSGAHIKVVQSVMRHSTITLTMDTYGHLFPGEASDAVVRAAEWAGASK